MKKSTLPIGLALLLGTPAVFGDQAKASKEDSACCSEKNSAQTKAPCSAGAKSKTASAGPCKNTPTKQALLSPKAAAEVGR